MDLKLRRLQLVRRFNNRQDDRDSGSLRTRPVPRTVPMQRNALPAPPTTSPGTQNGLSLLRRPDRISSSDFSSSRPRRFPCSRPCFSPFLLFLRARHYFLVLRTDRKRVITRPGEAYEFLDICPVRVYERGVSGPLMSDDLTSIRC